MQKQIAHALKLQPNAWNNGHENYGASIDVLSEAKDILEYFKHLNPVQTELLEKLKTNESLKYAKSLGSAARKVVRHYVITLK